LCLGNLPEICMLGTLHTWHQRMLQTSVHICLLWMDFTMCSVIHFSRSTNFMRGMNSNCQIREICTCFPTLYNPLFTSLPSRCLPTHLPHVNDFQICKPNGTMMTSKRAVLFLPTIAWRVNVVYVAYSRSNRTSSVYSIWLSSWVQTIVGLWVLHYVIVNCIFDEYLLRKIIQLMTTVVLRFC